MIRLEDGLYGAGVEDLLSRLREVEEAVGSVLVVGHNPTLHEVALALTARRTSLEHFPTGALASIAFGDSWSEVDESVADLESFVVPRELGD